MIVQRIRNGTHAIIPHEIANNAQLSADALGVMAFILCQPQSCSSGDVMSRFGLSKAKLESVVEELRNADLVETENEE